MVNLKKVLRNFVGKSSLPQRLRYYNSLSDNRLLEASKGYDDLDASHGKRLMEVLKYIVSGEKISSENQQVNDLEKVVSKIKKRPEVTKKYMQQWDRERHLVMDAKKEDAIEHIRFCRKLGASDTEIKENLETNFKLSPSTINELFAQVDSEELETNTK
jgi:hypothetical protein